MDKRDHLTDEAPSHEAQEGERAPKEVDLNALFPETGFDLNRLFPDERSKKLLQDLKRNKREIERFIKNLDLEEG